jgi:hypothetical protein
MMIWTIIPFYAIWWGDLFLQWQMEWIEMKIIHTRHCTAMRIRIPKINVIKFRYSFMLVTFRMSHRWQQIVERPKISD